MSTGIANGTDLILLVEGTAIAHCTNHTLNASMAPRTSSDKDSAGWESNNPGVRSWSVDFSGLYYYDAAYGTSDLFGLYTAETQVSLRFTNSTTADKYFHGEAYITSLSIGSPSEGDVSFSGSFIGDGALTESTNT